MIQSHAKGIVMVSHIDPFFPRSYELLDPPNPANVAGHINAEVGDILQGPCSAKASLLSSRLGYNRQPATTAEHFGLTCDTVGTQHAYCYMNSSLEHFGQSIAQPDEALIGVLVQALHSGVRLRYNLCACSGLPN